jgi:sterol 14alpha-demethylase
MLRLASRPDIVEEIYQEQLQNLGVDGIRRPLEHSDLDRLPLMQNVIKETLRVHSSIHSIIRKVKQPLLVPKTDYVITPDKVPVASPLVTHLSEEHFRNALVWDPQRCDDHVEAEKDEEDMEDYGYGC